MANGIWGNIKSNWKPILWGLIPFLIIVIIFSLPIKRVPIQITETYWANEMKTESYTVPEAYTATEPYVATENRTDTVYDSYVNSGNWSYTFDVSRPNSTVSINFNNNYNYNYPQYFYWTSDNRTRFFPWNYFWDYGYGSSGSRATIRVTYPEEVTKYRTVTKYRDVVKTREVPTQVLKERKVTQYVMMSLWAYLFFEQPK